MTLNTLLVCDDRAQASQIQHLISGEKSLTLLETVGKDGTRQAIETLSPHLVWIEFGSSPVRGLALLAELQQSFPSVMFLCSYREPDANLMRTAFRLRACDFLDHRSWDQDLRSSINRLQSHPQSEKIGQESTQDQVGAEDKVSPIALLLICDVGIKKRQTLEDLILGQPALTLAATVSSTTALERVSQLLPALVWLELGPDPQKALSLLAKLKENFPKTAVLVSHDLPDPELIRKSFRLGALDFLDAAHWRTDLPATIASLQPGRKQSFALARLLWLAGINAIGYLFRHARH